MLSEPSISSTISLPLSAESGKTAVSGGGEEKGAAVSLVVSVGALVVEVERKMPEDFGVCGPSPVLFVTSLLMIKAATMPQTNSVDERIRAYFAFFVNMQLIIYRIFR